MVDNWYIREAGVRHQPLKIATARAKHENLILGLYGMVPVNLENPMIRKELGVGPLINEYFSLLEQNNYEEWLGIKFTREYMVYLNDAMKRSSIIHDIRTNHRCPGYVILSNESVDNPIALRHIVSKAIIDYCFECGFGDNDGGGGIHILGELYPMADRMRELKGIAKAQKA